MALAWAYQQMNEQPDAVAAARKAVGFLRGNPPSTATLACNLAYSGRHDEARALLASLDRKSEEVLVGSYHVALVHAALNEPQKALDRLERAVGDREWWTRFLRAEPRFRHLLQDPRANDLLSRLGLRPAAAVASAAGQPAGDDPHPGWSPFRMLWRAARSFGQPKH